MLDNLRRKVGGMIADPNAPSSMQPPPSIAEGMVIQQQGSSPDYSVSQPFTSERTVFSQSAIPVWLQEQVGHLNFISVVVFFSRVTMMVELDGFELACEWLRWHLPSNFWSERVDW